MVKKLSLLARLVLFLRSEGFNSTQIRYICVEKLRIRGTLVYKKIAIYSKNVEENEADRRFDNENIAKKLKISGLLDEISEFKKRRG